MFERLEEEFKWVIDNDVTPCYWGDDWVIFHNLQESKATQIIQEERKNGSTPIMALQKWSQDIRPTHRLAWVFIWGLPPTVWEPESMGKVVAELGDLVEVGETVENRSRIDVARILIRTKRRPGIQSEVTAAIDGASNVIHVVEDMSCLGAWRNLKRMDTGFPPSPFSTEPNTPATAGGDFQGAASNFEISDSTPGDDEGFSTDGRQPYSLHSRRDHWVKAIGQRCLDRDFGDFGDFGDHGVMDQPTNDNNFLNCPPPVGPAILPEEASAQKLMMRSAINDIPKGDGRDKTHIQETQHGKLIVESPTGSARDSAKEQHKSTPNEATLPAYVDQPYNKVYSTPDQIYEDEGGNMGPRPKGPTPAPATRYYVRRKELLGYRGQALSHVESDVDLLTSPNLPPEVVTNSKSQDNNLGQISSHTLENQYALVKQMGLTHGEDSLQVRRMMFDMENRDTKKAA